MRYLIALIAATTLSACGGAPDTGPAKFEQKMIGKALPSVAADQVKTLTVKEMPAGFLFKTVDGAAKLVTVADYPTAGDAHTVLSSMTWPTGTEDGVTPEALAAAAKVGASAIIAVPKLRMAYAIHISTAKASGPSATGLLAKNRAALPKFGTVGENKTRTLNNTLPLEMKLAKGNCYSVLVALEEKASWGLDAKRILSVAIASKDAGIGTHQSPLSEAVEVGGVTFSAPENGRFVHLRSFVINVGCPEADTEATVALVGAKGSRKVGSGSVRLQAVSHTITDAELAKMKAIRLADAAAGRAQANSTRVLVKGQAAKAKAKAVIEKKKTKAADAKTKAMTLAEQKAAEAKAKAAAAKAKALKKAAGQ